MVENVVDKLLGTAMRRRPSRLWERSVLLHSSVDGGGRTG